MLFSELRELKELLVKYNERVPGEKAELWFPHMYADGKWSVTIVFGEVPDLSAMWEILSRCEFHGVQAFFGSMNEDIALFIQ